MFACAIFALRGLLYSVLTLFFAYHKKTFDSEKYGEIPHLSPSHLRVSLFISFRNDLSRYPLLFKRMFPNPRLTLLLYFYELYISYTLTLGIQRNNVVYLSSVVCRIHIVLPFVYDKLRRQMSKEIAERSLVSRRRTYRNRQWD